MPNSRQTVTSISLIGFFAVSALLIVAGFLFKSWLPPVASSHGSKVDVLIHYLLATTGTIFVIGQGALCWLIWKSGSSGATYRPVSAKTELLWALVPVGLMTVIS